MGRREGRLLSRWRTGEDIPRILQSGHPRRPRFAFKETAMFNLKTKLATAAIAVAASASARNPAIAGQCPTAGRQCSRQCADDAQGRHRHGDRLDRPRPGNQRRRPPAAHPPPGRSAGRHRSAAQPQGSPRADLHGQRLDHRISARPARFRSSTRPATSAAKPTASAIIGSTTARSPPSCCRRTCSTACKLPRAGASPSPAPQASRLAPGRDAILSQRSRHADLARAMRRPRPPGLSSGTARS